MSILCPLFAQELVFPGDSVLDAKVRGREGFLLNLMFYDKDSGFVLEKVNAKLFNVTLKKTEEGMTDENGLVTFYLEPGYDYEILGVKKRYLNRRTKINDCKVDDQPEYIFCMTGFNSFNYADANRKKAKSLYGEIALEKIDFEKAYKIENIYYDVDKADIRSDAEPPLNQIVQVLTDNPDIVIELSSHTDSRGSDTYNQDLSQRRADAAVAYIINKGIDPKMITARGYGESQLVNGCSNGVQCSKAKHQQNRRTEFKIIDLLEVEEKDKAQ